MRTALAVLLLAGHAAADEGGFSVQSGETLFAQGTSLGATYQYARRSRLYRGDRPVRGAEDRVLEEHLGVLGVSYGLREDLTLALAAPWVDRRERSDAGRERASGPGDATLLGKYRFLFDAGEAWESTAAAVLGLQLPTGSTDERDSAGGRLDPELQPGSGSWDFLAGAAGTYEWGRWEIRAHLLGQINTRGARDFEHEDIVTAGVGGSWRPLLRKYPGPEGGLSAGLTGQHAFRASREGKRVRDSGGDVLYGTLGAFFSPRTGIRLGVSADFPLFQDLNGEQLGLGLRVSLSLTVVF